MQKTFNVDIFMKNARGFYRLGCNTFKINGEPNMVESFNKSKFGVGSNFDFKSMTPEQIQNFFDDLVDEDL